jgi:hypothetical protein
MKTDTKIPRLKRKKRKTTPQEKLATVGRFFLVCVVLPFYYGWKALVWFYETFLTEVYASGNNGIFGPGYHSWESSRFSWGKFAILIIVIAAILFFIFC